MGDFRTVHIGGKNRGEPVIRKGYFEGSGLLIGFSLTVSTVIGLCPMLRLGYGSRTLQSYGFGVCRVLVCRLDDVLLSQDVWLWLYFIHGLVSGVSHGLG